MMKVDSDGSPSLHGIQCGMAHYFDGTQHRLAHQPLRSTSFSARTDWSSRMLVDREQDARDRRDRHTPRPP